MLARVTGALHVSDCRGRIEHLWCLVTAETACALRGGEVNCNV